ncbi:MAG TPA: hypothetical protein VL172_23550 [Kofleriaceae bacterium]|nr:hypothetical protein [Kofleriaceae bacterium]
MLRLLCTGVLAAMLSACGLIDSNVTDFDLSMPAKTFTVDTAQWDLMGDQNGEFPAIDCSQQDLCSAAVGQACGNEAICFGSCDSGAGTCQAAVLVALSQPVNLLDEKPELAQIEDQPLVSVTVDRIYYNVGENTMNVSTPEFMLYVAPENVMSPGDPQAVAVGTIAPLPAATTRAETDMVFVEGGEQALKDFMKDYKTTFRVIVGGQIELHAGDPVPTGSLTATVQVAAHAGI